MKKIRSFRPLFPQTWILPAFPQVLLLVLLLVSLSACEDVIEVETPVEDPRLVVEGLIRVDTTQEFVPVEIRLTQTAGFFDTVQPVSDATDVVILLQEIRDGAPTGNTFSRALAEVDPGSGVYVPDPTFDADQRLRVSTVLAADYVYTLILTWQGRRYAAVTEYVPSVPIDRAEPGDRTLFDEDETEVVVAFTDTPGEGDYYIFDFGFGEFLPSEDSFSDGEQLEFSFFYDQSFDPGTEIEISILGADQVFYNYMLLLVEQAGDSGNPFQTPVATVRGNVFDVTDLDNIDNADNTGQPDVFPLGFFAIVQEFNATVTIE